LISLLAVALAAAPPVARDPVNRWDPYVTEASHRFAIPADWIRRVIRLESGGATILHGLPIRSPAGAMGLMQVMPGTWREIRQRYSLGSNPDDPRDNILAGTAYMRLVYEQFGYPLLFAAYNAGPGRVTACQQGRGLLPRETRLYLSSVSGSPIHFLETRQHLFIPVGDAPVTRPVSQDPLFADRHEPARATIATE
jgi:soluble lytic murein transglycosylase-like protein